MGATKNSPGCGCCASTCAATYSGNVKGCNSLNLSGATITVKDHSTGTVLDTQTTDSSGNYSGSATVALAGTLVDIVFSKSRFVTATTTKTLSCGTNTVSGKTLLPATGYICGGCMDPFPTTLHLTTPSGSTIAITYDSASGLWRGAETLASVPVSCGGSGGVGNVDFQWSWGPPSEPGGAAMAIGWWVAVGGGGCTFGVDNAAPACKISFTNTCFTATNTGSTCPPSTNYTGTMATSDGGANYYNGSWTLTE